MDRDESEEDLIACGDADVGAGPEIIGMDL